MRGILIDGLVDVAHEFQLSDDTLYLALHLMDLMMNRAQIPRKYFQLLGDTCLLLASKAVDVSRITLAELAYICDGVFTVQQVYEMERKVLVCVDMQVNLITPLYFFRCYWAVMEDRRHQHRLASGMDAIAQQHDRCVLLQQRH
jgi:hypothetical protein